MRFKPGRFQKVFHSGILSKTFLVYNLQDATGREFYKQTKKL
jgi:hypothetical protein